MASLWHAPLVPHRPFATHSMFRQDRDKFTDFKSMWHSFASMFAFLLVRPPAACACACLRVCAHVQVAACNAHMLLEG